MHLEDQERHHDRVGYGRLGGIWMDIDGGRNALLGTESQCGGKVKSQRKGKNSNSRATEIISCATWASYLTFLDCGFLAG